jgi:hypothetical protein
MKSLSNYTLIDNTTAAEYTALRDSFQLFFIPAAIVYVAPGGSPSAPTPGFRNRSVGDGLARPVLPFA